MRMNADCGWDWYVDIDIESNVQSKNNSYKKELLNHNKIMRNYEELSYLDEFSDKEDQEDCFLGKTGSKAVITAILSYVIFFIL